MSAGLALIDSPVWKGGSEKHLEQKASGMQQSAAALCMLLCSIPAAVSLQQQGSSCTQSASICQDGFSSGMAEEVFVVSSVSISEMKTF